MAKPAEWTVTYSNIITSIAELRPEAQVEIRRILARVQRRIEQERELAISQARGP